MADVLGATWRGQVFAELLGEASNMIYAVRAGCVGHANAYSSDNLTVILASLDDIQTALSAAQSANGDFGNHGLPASEQ